MREAGRLRAASAPFADPGIAVDPGRRRLVAPSVSPVGGPAAEGVAGVYSAYQAELTAHLRQLTREAEVAEDLVQEAFLRLQREVLQGHMPDNPRAWLYRVAANLAISRGRRLAVARRRLAETWPEAGVADSPESLAIRLEGELLLGGVLRDLPPEARLALVLAAQGYSGREIALWLGRSEVATRTLICRARHRLRGRLLREERSTGDDR